MNISQDEILKIYDIVTIAITALNNINTTAFTAAETTTLLQTVFNAYVTCSVDIYTIQINILCDRLRDKNIHNSVAMTPIEVLILRLASQYPGDIGKLIA